MCFKDKNCYFYMQYEDVSDDTRNSKTCNNNKDAHVISIIDTNIVDDSLLVYFAI